MVNSPSPKGRSGGPLRSLLWFVLGSIVTLVVVALVLPVALVTHRTTLPGEQEFGGLALSMASRLNADPNLQPIPTAVDQVAVGRFTYSRMCAGCHGQEGDGNGPQSRNLFPPARSLKDGHAATLSDAQLVWMIENGLGFTGMPSFKNALNRDRVREVVAYIRTMQNGTSQAIPQITATPAPAVSPTPRPAT